MNTFDLGCDLSGGRRHIDADPARVVAKLFKEQRSTWKGTNEDGEEYNPPGDKKGKGRVNPSNEPPQNTVGLGCTPGLPKTRFCYDQARGMPRAAKVPENINPSGFNLAGCFPMKMFRKIGDNIQAPQGFKPRNMLSDDFLRAAAPRPAQGLGGAQSHVAEIIKEATRRAKETAADPNAAENNVTWENILHNILHVIAEEQKKICKLVNGEQPVSGLLYLL